MQKTVGKHKQKIKKGERFMKEIENLENEIEEQAKENVKNFDTTKLCYKQMFELLNNSGLFVKAFNEISGYEVTNKSQIKMGSLSYNIVKESDDKYYPQVEMVLIVKSDVENYFKSFTLLLTPFNAKLLRERGDIDCDEINKYITQAWRKAMKVLFRKKYIDAFEKYCVVSKLLDESRVKAKAQEDLAKIEQYYEEQINSI